MICAIDFGSCWIRSIFRSPEMPQRLSMYLEKSEYALIQNVERHHRLLQNQQIPFAECEGALVVAGNSARKAQWLSRVPLTPLLAEGVVPVDDPPARQILNVLTEAMLPKASGASNLCVLTIPGLRDGSVQTIKSEEFLCRLVRMQGYRPVVVHAAEAALLATCSETSFTGISIVLGAETTSICVARFGSPLAKETIAVGSNWIDTEIAAQFKVQVWDERGDAYLDVESVRQWKHETSFDLQNALSEREGMMSRLYTVLLDRVVRTVSQMLSTTPVRNALQQQRLAVKLSGGGAMLEGIVGLLTEKFIEQGIAERILSVRCASDPANAVIRGALIFGELEAQAMLVDNAA
jgi:hypothetical protein